jgi:hypothetical protein
LAVREDEELSSFWLKKKRLPDYRRLLMIVRQPYILIIA